MTSCFKNSGTSCTMGGGGMLAASVYIFLMGIVSIAHGKPQASIRRNHTSLGKRSRTVTKARVWRNLYKWLKICHLCIPTER